MEMRELKNLAAQYKFTTDRLLQDCALEMSVDLEEADQQTIQNLQEISIVCSKTSNPYLKASKTGKYHVIGCDELASYIWNNTKQSVEQHDRPKEVAAT